MEIAKIGDWGRLGLRARVALGFCLLAACVAAAMAAAVFHFTLELESRLVHYSLEVELNEFLHRWEDNKPAPSPRSSRLAVRVFDADKRPFWLQQVVRLGPDDAHIVSIDGRSLFVLVKEQAGFVFVALLDTEGFAVRERELASLLGMLLLIALMVSAALGWWLAGRAITPLSSLALEVSRWQPDGSLNLGWQAGDDEVARLQSALDHFRERLAAFVIREKAFAADASHELRTPVSVISGALELMEQQGGVDAVQDRALARMRRAVDDMQRLIPSLMALTREPSGSEQDRADNGSTLTSGCQVDELVRQSVDRLSPLLRARPVSVSLDLSPLSVEADCCLLRILVENLVRNAFTLTQEGEVQLRLDATGLSVIDTGPGLSGLDEAKAFERFHQGREGGMAGVGLELSRRVAKRHGWELTLKTRKQTRGAVARLRFNPKD